MPSSWKWKVILLAFLTLFAVYTLVPTFAGFKEISDKCLEEGKPLPWYFEIFPAKWINMGLDLRGGIYLEFEVELSKAIENKVDSMVSDLQRIFKDENIQVKEVRQDASNHTIVITAASDAELQRALEFMNKNWSDTVVKKSATNTPEPTLVMALTDKYHDYMESQISRQALEKVRNRIDRYGVAEPSIQRLGSNRIAVELPGMKDPDRAIGIIKKAGQLEFKIVNTTIQTPELQKLIAEAKKANEIPDDYSIKTVARVNEALKGKLPQDTEIAFETQMDPVTKKITGGIPYLLDRKAEVTGDMLKNTQVNVNNNEPYVSLSFDAVGTQKFGETTTKNVGKQMAILLDGTVTKAPVIREPITGGQAQITLGYGNYTDLMKEAEDLSLVLQEGALPAQLTEATKTIIGPSLGSDSIHKGVWAAIVGTLIVIIFMIVYYKFSGFLADFALIFNFLFLLAALALFQATLTLPGIAGIALTFGMAVDANVLIFERIKEELSLGKTIKAAVDAGYNNAMRAIIDSNLTTLIAAVVLYQFGTGPIKGFAVTLIIGIVVSMYTAIICTRMMFDWLIIKRKVTHISV